MTDESDDTHEHLSEGDTAAGYRFAQAIAGAADELGTNHIDLYVGVAIFLSSQLAGAPYLDAARMMADLSRYVLEAVEVVLKEQRDLDDAAEPTVEVEIVSVPDAESAIAHVRDSEVPPL